MLFYDYLPFIQRSKNEFEAREKREEIRNKLGSLVVSCYKPLPLAR